ncbi:glycoside hydrolase family 3 C-terminal domain-containing protein [Rhodoblastus acidophilus]|uniref:beta-glucosidase n=1 Tax=Candidatus Rhodoblastus alkanivorans TaxID=2954117 RepID=A0ABS9Z4B7_9HYPH|nr:glycoside hydrolase family 3 N-terminal domain-containing protein [Candidatus Rhodoblastus alkanivorans]MCI4679203.1 glycoside hydrolase family 3 C-terminal domain-containing protein [Candidatus Rhodoblastus alkanivorans]MCI4682473.1 glycoside hydrolase family 3 C-terminal domain-containing protein [Candidatus Rhodoblastus alkanivorans]MDI4639779.1 glycoside hydrolase family 3 C-terminal domain-containing protein [Rhodoblastus acidophilus]
MDFDILPFSGSARRKLSRRAFLAGSAALATVARALAAARPLAPDPHIEDLLRRMTLEEKAAQLSIFRSPISSAAINPQGRREPTREDAMEDVRRGLAAGYFNGFDIAFNRELQRIAVEESRLRIPLIFAADVIHGLKTTYPIPLGEAASFDPELCRRTARAAAEEASAFGLHWTFAPAIDVARDERWGRVLEGAGEDSWLGARIAAARVRGFQGDDLRADDSLLACPKHFAGYGGVEGGMEYNTVDIPETELRQVHLPPFKAAFDAGALSTMTAFNDIAGVPCTANRRLLTEILRGEWRFRGLVVSDFQSVRELIDHGYAADEADAVVKALDAGCDVALGDDIYRRHIPALVRKRRLAEAKVNESARRVLRVKKALGLFENPYRSLDPDRRKYVVRRPDMVALAREAARKSIVLLKNKNDLLPLPRTGKSLAFIGPYVPDTAQALGAWALDGEPERAVSLEQGVRAALGPGAPCSFTRGCAPEDAIPGGVEAAVRAVQDADVAVLYLGEPERMSGESASTTSIVIPPCQQDLAEAVAATGKPLVVILKHGRALALSGAVRAADAILCSWFLGSESGNALADLLFGDFSPQGRLPVSFPQASGQEPFYYDHRSTGRPQSDAIAAFKARYTEVSNEPLFAFGHGLTYSTVEYGETLVSAPRPTRNRVVKISAQLLNKGRRAAHETAQLYVHERVAAITQPVRQLKGVQHVELAPGEAKMVEFTLRLPDLAHVHGNLADRADHGAYDVWIAPSAISGRKATFFLA